MLDYERYKCFREGLSLENWNDISKNLREAMGIVAKRTEEIRNKVTDALNNFAKTEEFQRLVEMFNNIPDDVQKTVFFQKCQYLSKNNLTYEEVEWLFDELEIANMKEANAVIQKCVDKDNVIHNYIKNIMENDNLGNREKLIIVLCHFERLIYSALRREKKRKEGAKAMLNSELIKNNHGMDSKNLYRTVLLAITNVVFANTDNFTNIDRRLPFRNNILHRGLVDYTNIEVDTAYETLLIFVAHIMQMNESLTTEVEE